MVFFVFSELSWEVIVHFVDIGGIDDHLTVPHCLSFLFIIDIIKTNFQLLVTTIEIENFDIL